MPRYRAAEAQRDEADFAIDASEAEVDHIKAILVDLMLVAPRSGRRPVPARTAGEVVGAGRASSPCSTSATST